MIRSSFAFGIQLNWREKKVPNWIFIDKWLINLYAGWHTNMVFHLETYILFDWEMLSFQGNVALIAGTYAPSWEMVLILSLDVRFLNVLHTTFLQRRCKKWTFSCIIWVIYVWCGTSEVLRDASILGHIHLLGQK